MILNFILPANYIINNFEISSDERSPLNSRTSRKITKLALKPHLPINTANFLLHRICTIKQTNLQTNRIRLTRTMHVDQLNTVAAPKTRCNVTVNPTVTSPQNQQETALTTQATCRFRSAGQNHSQYMGATIRCPFAVT
jgi:hypothetical protein